FFFSKSGFQIIYPNGFFIVFGKKRACYPIVVPALQHPEHKNLFSENFRRTQYLNLSGITAHAWSANGPAYSAHLLVCFLENIMRLCIWDGEIILCPGIPAHKHIV